MTKKVYDINVVKKVTGEGMESQEINWTWAKVINSQKVYVTSGINNDVDILFTYKSSITRLVGITKEFAREHFEIMGEANGPEGQRISKYINQIECFN